MPFEVVTIRDCTLYLGDCLEVLPTLGKVDAVVTDPPYGIGVDAAMHKNGGTKYGRALAAKRQYAETNWDSSPATSQQIDAMCNISTWQIIFGGNYFNLPPSRCWLVWDKKINGDYADCELAWSNLDKPVKRIEWMWNGMLRQGGEKRNNHPTQKPIGVMKWCISHLPRECTTILDPFMGSGTTGVACVNLGRKFIGIEIEPKYFDIACKRIEKAYQDQALLDLMPVKEPEHQPVLDFAKESA